MTQVTLHVWRVPRRSLPAALGRMAVDRRRLRATPGVRFAKLLGTGTGTGFGPADADLTRWAALVVWDDPAAAAGFDETPVARCVAADQHRGRPDRPAPGRQPGHLVRRGAVRRPPGGRGRPGRCWR